MIWRVILFLLLALNGTSIAVPVALLRATIAGPIETVNRIVSTITSMGRSNVVVFNRL